MTIAAAAAVDVKEVYQETGEVAAMDGQMHVAVAETDRSPVAVREKEYALSQNAVTGDQSPAAVREKGYALTLNAVTGDRSPVTVREKGHALSRNPVDVPRRGGSVMAPHQA